MSIEIEAKMQVSDMAALEETLACVGAKRGPILLELNTFFDTPHGKLRTADQGLRVRVEQDQSSREEKVTVTHKGPRAQGKLKQRAETELVVADAKSAMDLLTVLGFSPMLSFEKKRKRWELGGCHVELDSLPYLGDFVEIEGQNEKAIMAVRETLGLGNAPLIRAGYASLLATYLAEHHIQTDLVRLEE